MTTKAKTHTDQLLEKFSLSGASITHLNQADHLEESSKEQTDKIRGKINKYREEVAKEIEAILRLKLKNTGTAFTDEDEEFLFRIFIQEAPLLCINVADGWRFFRIGPESLNKLKGIATQYGFENIRSLLKAVNKSMDGLVKIEPDFAQIEDHYDFLFTLFE